jgi:prepilin-type N-terminal cleavage/methylation domain-containing protein/prepilin-type processing-associated H-X9-DG protein
MKRRGFSLVELLVVISILFVLIGMLIPALNRARESGRLVACAAHLGQIGKAHTAYASEHKDRWIEGALKDDNDYSAYSVWGDDWTSLRAQGKYRGHGALYKLEHLDDSRAFYCPSWAYAGARWGVSTAAVTQNGWPGDDDPAASGTTRIWTGYHYRGSLSPPLFRSPRVSDPAHTAVMADAFSDPLRGVNSHHGTGYTTLYFDGHAAFLPDISKLVENKNGGAAYDSTTANYVKQEEIWVSFFDSKK